MKDQRNSRKSKNGYWIFLIFILHMVFYVGNHNAQEKQMVAENEEQNSLRINSLIDGQYIGDSMGYMGMKVRVLINEGQIDSVIVIEALGDVEYYQTVIDSLPIWIIEKGSVDVETITGATISSNSLIEAVKNALLKAKGNPKE